MKARMTWKEIEKRYPDEWVLIIDYHMNKYGQIIDGVLVTHSKIKEDIFSYPLEADKMGFLYTGEGNFHGLRSHAESYHQI